MRRTNLIFACLMIAPIILWLLTLIAMFFLGYVFNCKVNEGYVQTCKVFGIELGESIYTVGIFAAWGPLIFGPVVLGTGLLWAVVALIATIRKRFR
ncbi:hypothetical protein SAMN05444000_13121 [Shimia gijangensis]|uniref:Uncharacterized protein n=1 Tax=Shimia gijangensis TaxID=1470563 RepID=A0A1M6SQC1_9RHOB|nr:hypothetical protein [Shimia gijangensis]SHK46885.1 hypothetical protein SAMN05444000_13121 [Shimia gijangensis]